MKTGKLKSNEACQLSLLYFELIDNFTSKSLLNDNLLVG